MSIFNINTPFWQFMNKMADAFLLSLLWIICSVPIITFGASTTALLTGLMRLHRDCEGSLIKDFFEVFKKHFLHSTLMWLTHLVIFAVLAADLWLCWKMKTKAGAFFLPVIAVLGLILLMASYYTWPLVSHTGEKTLKIWKMAVHLAVAFLPHSLAMLVLEGLGIFISFTHPGLMILIPFIVGYQYARVYVWAFTRDPLTADCLDSSAEYCFPGAECAENITKEE